MQRKSISLNGQWQFQPLAGEAAQKHKPPPAAGVPVAGWEETPIMVPGSWNDGGCPEKTAPEAFWLDWRIFDSCATPSVWHKTLTAWYRRLFDNPLEASGRAILHLDGALRCAWVFVNGREVGVVPQGIMPAAFDITDALVSGANELAVYCTDYPRDARGKALVPAGLDQVTGHLGLWQDVWLEVVPEVRTAEVRIHTRVRDNALSVDLTLANASDLPCTVVPCCNVLDGVLPCLDFRGDAVTLAAGETRVIHLTAAWCAYRAWSPQSPQLYDLSVTLLTGNAPVDSRRERFGFREVWTEGPHVMLNDAPVHMFGEWCHKVSLENFRPEYIRQWFRMLKDMNMNYIRTHMFPHPRLVLELADEMGILVCLESAFAFGSNFAIEQEAFWQAAEQHARDNVAFAGNHPSVILYSVGNEVRWSGNQAAIIRNYPRLWKIYDAMDPDRIAYCDGDSSLWDERTQKIISRHYGFECTGEGWWDRGRPLHVGEVGKWHYSQPIDNAIWGDDTVYSSWHACHEAIAREVADQAGLARANGVACFFPWNISGLNNYRPWPVERRFEWPEPDAPHVKPARSAPYGAEFAWWDSDGPGYAPGPGHDLMVHAFRPLALVVREKRSSFYSGQTITHTVSLVNDTGADVCGPLTVELRVAGRVVWRHAEAITVGKGLVEHRKLGIPAEGDGPAVIDSWFTPVVGIGDEQSRRLTIHDRRRQEETWGAGRLAIYGDGRLDAVLSAHGLRPRRLGSLAEADPKRESVLLVEKGAIEAGSQQHRAIERYARSGGRAILLEQSASAMPAISIDLKPAERCHIRAGRQDLLAGFQADDFAFWGDDPYGVNPSRSWVTTAPYRKPTAGNTRIFLHSGWGDFGKGGLLWTPLFETRLGEGLVIACQLRLTEKLGELPVADRLLRQLVEYAAHWDGAALRPACVPASTVRHALKRVGAAVAADADAAGVTVAPASAIDPAEAARLAGRAAAGGTVVVQGVQADSAALLGNAFGIDLATVDVGKVFSLVRAPGLPDDEPMLEGLSHAETYWIGKGTYTPKGSENRIICETLLDCRVGEPLLVSEYDSCWREFFEYGAASELYRMPVVTHLLGSGHRPYGAGLLRIPHGKGALIICQVMLPTEDDNPWAAAVWSALLGNLGVELRNPLFAGDTVTAGSRRSDGFPVQVLRLADPDEDTLARITDLSDPRGEYRLHNQAIVNSFPWEIVDVPAGAVAATGAALTVLCFQVHAGRPRLAQACEADWPDPQQQTLLNLAGQGRVTAWINGREFAEIDLGAEGTGVVPDIDLVMEWNTVVLLWKNKTGNLRINWRNRQGEPEVEFEFAGKPWDAA